MNAFSSSSYMHAGKPVDMPESDRRNLVAGQMLQERGRKLLSQGKVCSVCVCVCVCVSACGVCVCMCVYARV